MSFNVGELAFYLTLDDSHYMRGMAGAEQKANRLASVAKTSGQVIASTLTAATVSAGALGAKLFSVGKDYNVLQQNSGGR